jgi:hypothetical protein
VGDGETGRLGDWETGVILIFFTLYPLPLLP